MAVVLVLLAGFYVSAVVDCKVPPKEELEKDFKLQTATTNEVGVFKSPGGGGDRRERLISAFAKILRLPIQRDNEDLQVMRDVASESEISKALIDIMVRRGTHGIQDHRPSESFMKNMFNLAADEEEVLRKRVAAAFTSLFRLPPEWGVEKSRSYQQVASEKEVSKALASLLAKRGNQQIPKMKGGGSFFDRLFEVPAEEGITMEKVTTALAGMIKTPQKNNKEPLAVKSVASEREISKAIVNIIARRRSRRQAVNEDDIRRAICSVAVTPGEFFRLVAGSVNCRDVVACNEDGLRALRCPPGLAFSLQDQACDWKQNVVDCHLKVRDKAHTN